MIEELVKFLSQLSFHYIDCPEASPTSQEDDYCDDEREWDDCLLSKQMQLIDYIKMKLKSRQSSDCSIVFHNSIHGTSTTAALLREHLPRLCVVEDSEALDEWNAPSPPAIIVTADKLLIPDRLIKMDSKSIELIHMSLPFLNDNAFDYHLRRTEKLKVDPQIYLNRFTCILQPKDEADENSRNSRRRDQMKLIHLIQCGNELEDDMKPFNDLVSTLSCLDKCSKLTERDLSRYSDISELLKSDLLGWKRNAGDEDRVQSSCRKSFRLNRIGMEDTHDLELRLKFSRLLDITDAALNKEVVDTAQDGGGGDDDNPFL